MEGSLLQISLASKCTTSNYLASYNMNMLKRSFKKKTSHKIVCHFSFNNFNIIRLSKQEFFF